MMVRSHTTGTRAIAIRQQAVTQKMGIITNTLPVPCSEDNSCMEQHRSLPTRTSRGLQPIRSTSAQIFKDGMACLELQSITLIVVVTDFLPTVTEAFLP